ncbi:MAG: AAA family ATPase, partial [Caldimicrobium sp.]
KPKPHVEPYKDLSDKAPSKTEEEIKDKTEEEIKEAPTKKETLKKIHLQLIVPRGRLSDVARIVNLINNKFSNTETRVEITASEGEITPSEYEDKILEALKQSGITIEKAEKK